MENIMEFSRETIEGIGYYVYRLIDPRNGETFYVGKGKGNRVFQHVKGVKEYLEKDDDEEHDYSKDPFKLQRIKDIHDARLEVIHVIQRWGLPNSHIAYEVESAIIDCYSGLTNIVSGHASDRGVCNALELEKRFTAKEYDESTTFGYIIIKVGNERVNYCSTMYGGDDNGRYEATRWRWKNRIPSIKKYPYVLSVTNGIVKEVYAVEKWEDAGEGRIQFFGKIAEESIRKHFLDHRIPNQDRKKGMASPFLKSKNL